MSGDTVPVWVALSRVQAELPAIGKGDRNQQEGFNFRSSEAINRHLSPLLAKHGVVIVPKSTVRDVRPSPAMKEGWQDVYLSIDWTIYGPDGSHITARTNGIGRDKVDRGANKAATQAYKYLVLQLFGVADKDDDSDGQSYEHDRIERPPAPQQDPEAVRVFELIRSAATVNPDAAAELKTFAANHNRLLTVNALSDNEWRQTVEAALSTLMAEPQDGGE